MAFRIEKDTMGEVQVPCRQILGSTNRTFSQQLQIGPAASMPHEIIEAFGYLKNRCFRKL